MTAPTLRRSQCLITALWACEADRSSSETEDEEVEAGRRSAEETGTRSGRGAGGRMREGAVCVCVSTAFLWRVPPLGTAVSHILLLQVVSQTTTSRDTWWILYWHVLKKADVPTNALTDSGSHPPSYCSTTSCHHPCVLFCSRKWLHDETLSEMQSAVCLSVCLCVCVCVLNKLVMVLLMMIIIRIKWSTSDDVDLLVSSPSLLIKCNCSLSSVIATDSLHLHSFNKLW